MKNTRIMTVLNIIPDILAFGLGLSLAYFLKWETRDLVWSLWLSSLVLGYLTILSIFAGGVLAGVYAIINGQMTRKQLIQFITIGTLAGLFLLSFFSIHFCGFHAGHSVFLNSFFPVEGMPEDGFGSAFMNPPLLWLLVFRHLMKPYGIFLIPAIISERNNVFMPLIAAIRALRPDMQNGNAGIKGMEPKNIMGRPYLNVVRMHILIFFFAFCYILKISSFLVYTVVYFVYFFPWKGARILLSRKQDLK